MVDERFIILAKEGRKFLFLFIHWLEESSSKRKNTLFKY
jgi:hypothetical protein